MRKHRRAPDHSRTSEVQRWLQQKLSISHSGRNFPAAPISRLFPHLSRLQSPLLQLKTEQVLIFCDQISVLYPFLCPGDALNVHREWPWNREDPKRQALAAENWSRSDENPTHIQRSTECRFLRNDGCTFGVGETPWKIGQSYRIELVRPTLRNLIYFDKNRRLYSTDAMWFHCTH